MPDSGFFQFLAGFFQCAVCCCNIIKQKNFFERMLGNGERIFNVLLPFFFVQGMLRNGMEFLL